MATAKKLPSGSWRCQVYDFTEILPDGTKKRHYKSFTVADPSARGKRKCEAMAAEWAAEKESRATESDMSFGEALEQYITSREAVLSPTTIHNYRSTQRNHLKTLMDINVSQITQEDIQNAINRETRAGMSPKSIRNIHGLISAVMSTYRPEFALQTALPKKMRVDLYIPSDNDVKRLLEACRGTELELPILLAAFGPMRRGEICALTSDDINGNIVHVCRNMVQHDLPGGGIEWILKAPKSYAGDRYINYPDFVADKFKGLEGRIVHITPGALSDRFADKLRVLGLPHFRFHDLRHYSASIQHALGIPDAYIMQRGGWETDSTLKGVYRHALADQSQTMDDVANAHFSKLSE